MRAIFALVYFLVVMVGPLFADTKSASETLYLICDGELREEIKDRIKKKKFGYVIYKDATSIKIRSEYHFFKDCRLDDLNYWCKSTSPMLDNFSATNTIDFNRVTGEVLQISLPDHPTRYFDNLIFEGFCKMSSERKID